MKREIEVRSISGETIGTLVTDHPGLATRVGEALVKMGFDPIIWMVNEDEDEDNDR